MNFKTGVILILVGVALSSVVVGQRLLIRSVTYQTGMLVRELSDLEEQNRVLNAEYAKKRDPLEMYRFANEHGLQLLPPVDNLPDIPGKPKTKSEGQG